jgi:probable addiction module antidote protein
MAASAHAKAQRTHEEAAVNGFRRDPRFAAKYLNAVLEDGNYEELLIAFRYLAKAFGGVPKLARRAALNATTLYRTLSPKGNPELKSLVALLKALGMRLAVHPLAGSGLRNTVQRIGGSRKALPAVLPRARSGRSRPRGQMRRAPPRASRAAA